MPPRLVATVTRQFWPIRRNYGRRGAPSAKCCEAPDIMEAGDPEVAAGKDEETRTNLTRPEEVELTMKAVLGPAQPVSGSQAFPVLGSDNGRWYAKAPNNPQGGRILVTEYLLSRAGRVIGAPVCEVEPMAITTDLAGFQVLNGPLLEVGIASASREIADAVEIRATLQHREQDDNARRHGGVIALFDWCWGEDPQWLVVETDEHRLYSHDHGLYLPPGGANWNEATLIPTVDVPHPLAGPPDGLDTDELERLALALRALELEDLRAIASTVPARWAVTDEDLEAVCDYLLGRAPQVAARLDELRETLVNP